MPEGPEVRILAEHLNKHYKDHIITDVQVPSNLKHNDLNPIINHKINNIISYGKSILFITDNGLLESKLAMEGKWLRRPGLYTKVIMQLLYINHITNITFNKVLYFDDMRNFGSLMYHNDYQDLTSRVGFDLLQYAIDSSDLITATNNLLDHYIKTIRKHNNIDVTSFIMNQKYFSGVGNYLKAEILYMCNLYPGAKLIELTDQDCCNMLYHSLDLILQAYRGGGLTIRTYQNPSGIKGTFNTKVYNQSKDPNGYPIVKQEFQDKRTTHYCPTIQILHSPIITHTE